MPSQCSIASTVVALNEAPLSLCGTGRCSGARSAICSVRAVRRTNLGCVFGAVAVVHFPADDLAAVQVQNQEQLSQRPTTSVGR